MDILSQLPAEYYNSLVVLLLMVIGFLLWLHFSGRWVHKSRVEDAQKVADRFQRAWEVSQETQSVLSDTATKLGILTNTFAHFIESLPPSAASQSTTTPPSVTNNDTGTSGTHVD